MVLSALTNCLETLETGPVSLCDLEQVTDPEITGLTGHLHRGSQKGSANCNLHNSLFWLHSPSSEVRNGHILL